MKPTGDEVAHAVGKEASRELAQALERIKHCVGQLTDEQVWWRPDATRNSIANLMLHLCGNVRQHLIAGLAGLVDQRDRPQEFLDRSKRPKAELLRQLEETVSDACKMMEGLSAAELLRLREVQGKNRTGLESIFTSVAHFRGHTQEIIHMTRTQLGKDYRFAGPPPEPAMRE